MPREPIKPHNPSAFPLPHLYAPYGQEVQPIAEGSPGMSLRDWFAGQALAGMIAHDNAGDMEDDILARTAYRTADAMLAERTKGEGLS